MSTPVPAFLCKRHICGAYRNNNAYITLAMLWRMWPVNAADFPLGWSREQTWKFLLQSWAVQWHLALPQLPGAVVCPQPRKFLPRPGQATELGWLRSAQIPFCLKLASPVNFSFQLLVANMGRRAWWREIPASISPNSHGLCRPQADLTYSECRPTSPPPPAKPRSIGIKLLLAVTKCLC